MWLPSYLWHHSDDSKGYSAFFRSNKLKNKKIRETERGVVISTYKHSGPTEYWYWPNIYDGVENNLQLYGTFFMFGAVLAVLLPISYIILPETKDISLGPVVKNPLSPILYLHKSYLVLSKSWRGKYLDMTANFRAYRANIQEQIRGYEDSSWRPIETRKPSAVSHCLQCLQCSGQTTISVPNIPVYLISFKTSTYNATLLSKFCSERKFE